MIMIHLPAIRQSILDAVTQHLLVVFVLSLYPIVKVSFMHQEQVQTMHTEYLEVLRDLEVQQELLLLIVSLTWILEN